MINLCLCDDDETILVKLTDILKNLSLKHNININITTYPSGELLLIHTYEILNEIDIIYLDINMDKLNGIETAHRLRSQGYNSVIIYLTSLPDYVFQCFETNPLNYIIKSEMYSDKFESVFLKALTVSQNSRKNFFLCKNSSEYKKIPLHCISYFEISNRIVTVHYVNEQCEQHSFGFYSKISRIMEMLSSNHFARIHRSFLVNISFVSSVKSNSLNLFTGENLPIGKTYSKDIKKLLSNYLSSDCIGLD